MLVSINNEVALAEANRPPDARVRGSNHLRSMAPSYAIEKGAIKWHGLKEGPKYLQAPESTTLLRPEQSGTSSNEDNVAPVYEYDDLPILESNRTSCCTPRYPVVTAPLTLDESVDRLSDSVPEGELHVWVYQAHQLSTSWSITSAMYDKHGFRVRCALLGAVQESQCHISGGQTNPVWCQTENGTRDSIEGHFAWALGQSEETTCDRMRAEVETNECKLEIDIVCGECIVGSAKVALGSLLQSSKTREENASSGSSSLKIVSSSPHWLPLAGDDAGLLQIALEFIPAPTHKLQDSSKKTSLVISHPDVADEHNANQTNAGIVGQRMARSSRSFAKGSLGFSCLDKRHDALQLDAEGSTGLNSKVIISQSGGVTMYIPIGERTPPKFKSIGSPPLAPKSSTSSFGLHPNADREQLIDNQLWDLYYFGISDEGSKIRDSEGFARTMSMASDCSSGSSDRRSRSGVSMHSRQASTCASDVLAYNELIQDMESAMKDTTLSSSTASNQEDAEKNDQSSTETTTGPSPASPELKVKPRRRSKPTLNFSKSLDRIHSLWHETKARTSNTSDASNDSNSPNDRSSGRKSGGCPSKNNVSPVAVRPCSRNTSPLKGKGVVLFDPQNLPARALYQRSTSRGEVLEATNKAERERQAAAAGPRRRSLPINSFSLRHRQDKILQQQQKRNRSLRHQFEAQLESPLPLLDSVDPPLLSRARSNSLHSMTDLYLPKTGDMHDVPVTVTATNTNNTIIPASSPAKPEADKETSTRRHSGSNVVYVNGASLCVGKIIDVGNVRGVVRFIGTTRFATGTWVGIELCEQKGKNNGTIDGKKYFSCAPNHGIFIRASRLGLPLQ